MSIFNRFAVLSIALASAATLGASQAQADGVQAVVGAKAGGSDTGLAAGADLQVTHNSGAAGYLEAMGGPNGVRGAVAANTPLVPLSRPLIGVGGMLGPITGVQGFGMILGWLPLYGDAFATAVPGQNGSFQFDKGRAMASSEFGLTLAGGGAGSVGGSNALILGGVSVYGLRAAVGPGGGVIADGANGSNGVYGPMAHLQGSAKAMSYYGLGVGVNGDLTYLYNLNSGSSHDVLALRGGANAIIQIGPTTQLQLGPEVEYEVGAVDKPQTVPASAASNGKSIYTGGHAQLVF